jgi:DNA-binding CsgD family transcriptional regulator
MMNLTHPAEQDRPAGAAVAFALADAASANTALLMRVLDEIDYGVLLVDASGQLRYANQLGLQEVSRGGPLQLAHGRLQARYAGDQSTLHLVLADAQRGRRRLFSAGHNGHSVSVAAVPMPASGQDDTESLALLVFGKRPAGETLTVDFYARAHALTATETSVLKGICGGLRPKEIARGQGVAISTVRSHICSIRIKTQTASIRELVNRVAVLPPITPAMKTASAHAAVQEHRAAVH